MDPFLVINAVYEPPELSQCVGEIAVLRQCDLFQFYCANHSFGVTTLRVPCLSHSSYADLDIACDEMLCIVLGSILHTLV